MVNRMTYQGSATISRVAKEIAETANNCGYEWIESYHIRRLLCESDVISTDEYDCWVDFTDNVPGDLESYPHIVYCLQYYESGTALAKTYKPIS